jgi:hypothetical protein
VRVIESTLGGNSGRHESGRLFRHFLKAFMDYLKPAEVVNAMIEAGARKADGHQVLGAN